MAKDCSTTLCETAPTEQACWTFPLGKTCGAVSSGSRLRWPRMAGTWPSFPMIALLSLSASPSNLLAAEHRDSGTGSCPANWFFHEMLHEPLAAVGPHTV